MMEKLIIAMIFVMSLFSMNINAITCVLNNPTNNQYDNGVIRLNATSTWAGGTTGQNTTNVTFTIGTFLFSNITVNGTGVKATTGDFTFTLISSSLTANTQYTAYATCRNDTDVTVASSAVNSSSVTYTTDTANPSVVVSAPLSGSTVVPLGNDLVSFEYTPTDTNFGNCSLHLNNQVTKSNTAGTTTANFTSGVLQRFQYKFSADNNSVRAVIECVDLAGLKGRSLNFTFNVLASGVPPAVQQALQSSAGGNQPISLQKILTPPSDIQTHFQQYGWIYAVVVIAVSIYLLRKKFRK